MATGVSFVARPPELPKEAGRVRDDASGERMPFERQPAAASWEPPSRGDIGLQDPMSLFPAEDEPTSGGDDMHEVAREMRGTCARMEELVGRAQTTLQRIEQLAAQTTAQLQLVAAHRPWSVNAAASRWHRRLSTWSKRARIELTREVAHARMLSGKAWQWPLESAGVARDARSASGCAWRASSSALLVARPIARLFASARTRIVWTSVVAMERAADDVAASATFAHRRTVKSIVLRIRYSWPIPADITAASGSALALMTGVIGLSVFRNTTSLSRPPQVASKRPAITLLAPLPIRFVPDDGAGAGDVPYSAGAGRRGCDRTAARGSARAHHDESRESVGPRFVGTLAIESDPIGAAVDQSGARRLHSARAAESACRLARDLGREPGLRALVGGRARPGRQEDASPWSRCTRHPVVD